MLICGILILLQASIGEITRFYFQSWNSLDELTVTTPCLDTICLSSLYITQEFRYKVDYINYIKITLGHCKHRYTTTRAHNNNVILSFKQQRRLTPYMMCDGLIDERRNHTNQKAYNNAIYLIHTSTHTLILISVLVVTRKLLFDLLHNPLLLRLMPCMPSPITSSITSSTSGSCGMSTMPLLMLTLVPAGQFLLDLLLQSLLPPPSLPIILLPGQNPTLMLPNKLPN